MSVNEPLGDELLKLVVEKFYDSARVLSDLPAGDGCNHDRIWHLSRMATLEVVGNMLADVLDVMPPDWAVMRDLAGAKP